MPINQSGSEQNTEKNASIHQAHHENMETYLKGVIYPAEKKSLLEYAKKNHAPQNILDCLNKLKDQKYLTQSDVSKSM